jgi:hypothetical protein
MGLLLLLQELLPLPNGSSSAASSRAAVTQVSFLPLLLPQT